MAKVFIEESTLTSIGNSIRNKTGKTDLIDPLYMSTEIDSISGGGGLPEELRVQTGSLRNKFSSDGWNSFLRNYKDQLEFKDITDMTNAFSQNSYIEELPFEFNLKQNTANFPFLNSFSYCSYLRVLPEIKLNGSTPTNFNYMFQQSYELRDFENVFNAEELESVLANKVINTNSYIPILSSTFSDCYSLRQLPSWVYKIKCSPNSTGYNSSFYSSTFNCCYALDEITNLPVPNYNSKFKYNMFSSAFYKAARIKNMTFEKQADGTPYVVNWNKQTIELNTAGYLDTADSYLTNYNSGITNDKIVTTAEQYQALKDDPDWYTVLTEYSRYNHDSAVATINSLPDTSAYLATVSGTNTIKFKGAAGSKTDGGAINTLTEEEIAVATAKGWTVTLV